MRETLALNGLMSKTNVYILERRVSNNSFAYFFKKSGQSTNVPSFNLTNTSIFREMFEFSNVSKQFCIFLSRDSGHNFLTEKKVGIPNKTTWLYLRYRLLI